MSVSLVEFLEARLAEDEALAHDLRAAGVIVVDVPVGSETRAVYQADRVLLEVAAKRAIVAEALSTKHRVVEEDCWYTCGAAIEDRDGGETCDDGRRGTGCDCGRDVMVERRLRVLASVFRGHPDYAEGWTL